MWAGRRRGERRRFTRLTATTVEALPGRLRGDEAGGTTVTPEAGRRRRGEGKSPPRPAPPRASSAALSALSMFSAGRSARRSVARAARLSVRRAGRKAERGPGLFGSGGAVRAAGSGGHGGPQVLPVDLGAVPLPQPGAEGASGELGAESCCLPKGPTPLRAGAEEEGS